MKHTAGFVLIFLLACCSFQCDETAPDEGTITILTPNGGERWQIGTTRMITWSSKNISGEVKIELSSDGGNTFASLKERTSNDGEEAWYISEQTTIQAIVRISSVDDLKLKDESDESFSIFEIITGPVNLQATVSSTRSVGLAWQDRSLNEQGFIIERKSSVIGAWGEHDRVAQNTVSYKDSGLAANRQYFYRVRAFASDSISGSTNTVSKILGWIQQLNTSSHTLFSVCYINTTTAIAVGESGTILRSTNGGDEWLPAASGTTNTLYAVSFTGSSIGIAVGEHGTILRTNDGGASWSLQNIGGSDYQFKGVDFATANDVYAAGFHTDTQFPDSTWGVVFRSVDGGINWSVISEQWFRYEFHAVAFPTQNNGVVIGCYNNRTREAILRTTNRGSIWAKQSGDLFSPLYGLHFLDAAFGVAVGFQGEIMISVNGGINWVDHSITTLKSLRSVAFSDWSSGITVGDNGSMYRTTNGGLDWTPQVTGWTNHFNGIFLSDSSTITIVGSEGLILKTNNGGR